MNDIVRPDIKAIKARLGSLSPTAVSRVAEVSNAVATLLVDLKHLAAYTEQLERQPRLELDFNDGTGEPTGISAMRPIAPFDQGRV